MCMETKSQLDEVEVKELAIRFEGEDAETVIRWVLERFHPRIALATSLQAEEMVILDIAWKTNPGVRVFTLDTGRLHEETYMIMEQIREKYGISVESYFPQRQAVEALERERGFYSFRRSVEERKYCCGIRKVEPLGRAVNGLDAWITGLRREQAVTRGMVGKVEADESHGGIIKVNPLADWSGEQVWDYIRAHDIPYNALHDVGFPSIGCAPCTRAIKPGEDIRAGRWWWEMPETKECGLHVTPVEGHRPTS
ncbi:MAG: phosphoadenylyl-sulfate reductase [candidate division NC10 bacterium]|nr:phosphoadenylyl-sulfate reductase [candidate division NC10 bacterium]